MQNSDEIWETSYACNLGHINKKKRATMTVDKFTNTNADKVRVFLVRHGQTDHNLKKILQGHVDVPLNETGVSQAKKVAERFKNVPLDAFVTSDLIRCVDTIKEIIELHPGNEELRSTPNLRERMMGEVEGMNIFEAISKYGESNFRNLGEKLEQLIERLEFEWENLIQDSIENDYKNYLLCTHGGVITAFSNYLYDKKEYQLSSGLTKSSLKVPFNTSVTIIDIDKQTKEGKFITFGDTEHLGGQYYVKNQLLR